MLIPSGVRHIRSSGFFPFSCFFARLTHSGCSSTWSLHGVAVWIRERWVYAEEADALTRRRAAMDAQVFCAVSMLTVHTWTTWSRTRGAEIKWWSKLLKLHVISMIGRGAVMLPSQILKAHALHFQFYADYVTAFRRKHNDVLFGERFVLRKRYTTDLTRKTLWWTCGANWLTHINICLSTF